MTSRPSNQESTDTGRLMGRRYHDANPDVVGSPAYSTEAIAWTKTWPGVPCVYFRDGYLAGFNEALAETMAARGGVV